MAKLTPKWWGMILGAVALVAAIALIPVGPRTGPATPLKAKDAVADTYPSPSSKDADAQLPSQLPSQHVAERLAPQPGAAQLPAQLPGAKAEADTRSPLGMTLSDITTNWGHAQGWNWVIDRKPGGEVEANGRHHDFPWAELTAKAIDGGATVFLLSATVDIDNERDTNETIGAKLMLPAAMMTYAVKVEFGEAVAWIAQGNKTIGDGKQLFVDGDFNGLRTMLGVVPVGDKFQACLMVFGPRRP